ncbi:hypothetical protein QN277_009442 [Acacia crassicarpa]|uniref:Uncharacterized protein n=1 Tax=Acacia crassicarpa TaxID=499986 RepID=A0AAE1MBV3_9FABA|nr:hypothetical protein QN277_009442 [Acacia crassicarpa]
MAVTENVEAIIGSSGENLDNHLVSSDSIVPNEREKSKLKPGSMGNGIETYSTIPNELEKSKIKPGSMGNGIETNVQIVNGDQNLNSIFNNNDIIPTTLSVPHNKYKA